MAIITRFFRDSRAFRKQAKNAECAYRLLTGDDGVEYLQLVTFGSEDRQNVGTGSQNVRMDEARAAELIDIILDAFPGIESRTRISLRPIAAPSSRPEEGV
ncbi:hypothetical protein ABZ477_14495 [Microbacterium sp. NPDC019599]|uniref:hypothetical protein n=1 Tax=Microbacterium sp. NPDC019599 TaxID=3154690 RepID=UPI0033C2D5F5